MKIKPKKAARLTWAFRSNAVPRKLREIYADIRKRARRGQSFCIIDNDGCDEASFEEVLRVISELGYRLVQFKYDNNTYKCFWGDPE